MERRALGRECWQVSKTRGSDRSGQCVAHTPGMALRIRARWAMAFTLRVRVWSSRQHASRR